MRRKCKKKMNRRVPHIREWKKGAAGTCERWGTTRPCACQREAGPIYLLKVSRKREKKRKKEKKRKEKKNKPKKEAAHPGM